MKRLVIIGLTVLVAFAISGCAGNGSSVSSSVSSDTASSNSAEIGVSVESASTASSDSVLLGSFEWPAEAFGNLPEPETEAKIIEANVTEGGATVRYRDMKEAEVAAYVEVMKSLGYTEDVSERKTETTYSYMAYRDDGDAQMDSAFVVYEVDKDGVATTSIARMVLK